MKVDDTEAGILEGVNAGTWTVGVSVSGNAVGLPLDEWRALDEKRQDELRQAAAAELLGAGADYVIDTVADLLPILGEIESKLAKGVKPRGN